MASSFVVNRRHISVYQRQSKICRQSTVLCFRTKIKNVWVMAKEPCTGSLLTLPWTGSKHIEGSPDRVPISHSISRHNEFGDCRSDVIHWDVEGFLKKYMQVCTCLLYSLWRLLPYRLRVFLRERMHSITNPLNGFHQQLQSTCAVGWPPKYSRRHILEPFSLFLTQKSKKKRPAPEAIGVDKLGRSFETAQLYFERWMIEELIGMGIRQGSLDVYRSALTHPSALDPEKRFLSYERLEYLGDAVLELVVRGLLMKRIKHADEGILTFQTQAMVKGDAVSAYSAWLGLDKFVMTNAYSMRSSLLESPSILCDAFEALIGAIYMDKGLHAAERFLQRVFTQCPYVDWESLTLEKNYVAELSRKAVNELEYTVPRYISVHSQECYRFPNGSSSVLLYWQQVYMGGSLWGIGHSFDERIAQQLAAKATLDMLQGIP